MNNKIKHFTATQSIPNAEFLPLLRGEAPYFGNLNRPAQSAYNLANTVAQIQSWGGSISILNQQNYSHIFKLYEIARIADGESLVEVTNSDSKNSRYGIVVAEAEFDAVTGLTSNIIVCTFCPNFVYPTAAMPTDTPFTESDDSLSLFLNLGDATFLAGTASGSMDRILAKKTGTNSIFFSGTATLWATGA